jgi:hypothetical protein
MSCIKVTSLRKKLIKYYLHLYESSRLVSSFLSLSWFLVCVLLLVVSPVQAKLSAALVKVDITPSDPQFLLGYVNVSDKLLEKLVLETVVAFDISRIESVGGLGRLIDGNSWSGQKYPFLLNDFFSDHIHHAYS